MKKLNIYLVIVLSIIISLSSCEKEPKEVLFDGESYSTSNGLNNTETALYDDRDDNVYAVVQIGDQLWMAENLRYDSPNSDLNPDNPNPKYGRLYTFTSRDQDRCPKGWHIPSNTEWKELEMALGMSQLSADSIGFRGTDEGNQLKSTTGWSNDGNGSNASGFNVLPAGYKDRSSPIDGSEGDYIGLGESGVFWTETQPNPGFSSNSSAREVSYSSTKVRRFANWPLTYYSCRCLLN